MRSVKRPAKTCCCYQLPLHSSVEENLQWEESLNRGVLFLKERVYRIMLSLFSFLRKRKQSWQKADPTPSQLPQQIVFILLSRCRLPQSPLVYLSVRTLHDKDGVSFSSFTVSGGILDGSPFSSHLRV